MKTPAVLALLLTALAATASAQTVSGVLDAWSFPTLGTEVLIGTELDGNPATREFTQTRNNVATGFFEIRGVAQRGAAFCIGSYFSPFASAAVAALPGEMLLFGFLPNTPGADRIQRYLVRGVRGYYEVSIGYGCGGPPDVPAPPAPPSPPAPHAHQ